MVVTNGATTLSRSHSYLTEPTDNTTVTAAKAIEERTPPSTEITIKSASDIAGLKPNADAVPLAKTARMRLDIRLNEPEASKF